MTWYELMESEIGYKPFTTFWDDFSIADAFGTEAVQETFDRAFTEWKSQYKYLTELTIVLNHKIWLWYEKNDELCRLYDKLWRQADQYACNTLQGEELSYYYRVTD